MGGGSACFARLVDRFERAADDLLLWSTGQAAMFAGDLRAVKSWTPIFFSTTSICRCGAAS
jgi:hypothetical protein